MKSTFFKLLNATNKNKSIFLFSFHKKFSSSNNRRQTNKKDPLYLTNLTINISSEMMFHYPILANFLSSYVQYEYSEYFAYNERDLESILPHLEK